MIELEVSFDIDVVARYRLALFHIAAEQQPTFKHFHLKRNKLPCIIPPNPHPRGYSPPSLHHDSALPRLLAMSNILTGPQWDEQCGACPSWEIRLVQGELGGKDFISLSRHVTCFQM